MSQASAYGYLNEASLRRSYPGGYRRTAYGFSGLGALRSDSFAIAASLALSSRGASRYPGSSWLSADHRCEVDGGSGMSCRQCVAKFGGACKPVLPREVNRDDLMSTGFWPVDVVSPLTVTITSLSGRDLGVNTVCHADDGSLSTSSEGADVYISLTQMQGMQAMILDADIEQKFDDEKSNIAVFAMIVGMFAVCATTTCVACAISMCRRLVNSGDEEQPLVTG